MIKNFNCLVCFEGHGWNNIFMVKSPSGVVKKLNCNGKWDTFSPELLALVTKYMRAKNTEYAWNSYPCYPEILSLDLLKEFKTLCE